MKKILIILFLIPVISFSQTIEKAITDIIDSRIDSKIKSFSYTLDSIIVRTRQSSSAVPFYIDTLKVPIGKTVLYQLSLNAKSLATTDVGFGIKAVQVTNSGGVYTVDYSADLLSYRGKNSLIQTKVSWAVLIVSGFPVVRVIGPASSVSWEYKKTTL